VAEDAAAIAVDTGGLLIRIDALEQLATEERSYAAAVMTDEASDSTGAAVAGAPTSEPSTPEASASPGLPASDMACLHPGL
jgi:hypothetical protein